MAEKIVAPTWGSRSEYQMGERRRIAALSPEQVQQESLYMLHRIARYTLTIAVCIGIPFAVSVVGVLLYLVYLGRS